MPAKLEYRYIVPLVVLVVVIVALGVRMVPRDYAGELRQALQGCDRIRISWHDWDIDAGPVVEQSTEVSDAGEIAEVISRIQTDGGDSRCKCGGNPRVEFFRGIHLLAAVTVHHGERLRWGGNGWKQDAVMTTEFRYWFLGWLMDQGAVVDD